MEKLGPKDEVLTHLKERNEQLEKEETGSGRASISVQVPQYSTQESQDFPTLSRDGYERIDKSDTPIGEPIVEMQGVRISYGGNSVLGDWQQTNQHTGTAQIGLHWNVHRGQRWGIFGANGSGKTTLLSLVTSDHPQTYSAPVKLFQRSRLPEPGVPGITIFEIQSRMGHASPEVHALFPKHLRIRTALESAWSDTPITKPRLDDEATRRVEACLRWFTKELRPTTGLQAGDKQGTEDIEWANDTLFGELSFSAQRVLLFLRATIRNPDIVILDEAFSGMDDLVRDKCLLFLSKGQSMALEASENGLRPVKRDGEIIVKGLQDHQALLCVSHSRQEVPGCIREWICLPEPGTGAPRLGKWDGPVELDGRRWGEVWQGE